VTSKFWYFNHTWISPQNQLILGKAMQRTNLLMILRPQQRTNVRPSIYRNQHCARIGIPEFDGEQVVVCPG